MSFGCRAHPDRSTALEEKYIHVRIVSSRSDSHKPSQFEKLQGKGIGGMETMIENTTSVSRKKKREG